MPSQELLVLVDTPNETLGVEYKSWLDLDDNETRADLARHIAAIANHGGGYIVFGFDDKTRQPVPNASSVKVTHDTITSVVKKYLEPTFQCDVSTVASSKGDEHQVVRVPAHGASPICAKANGPMDAKGKIQGITQGLYYIRKAGPESERILTAAEWSPVIRRCAMHERASILGALDAALRGSSQGQVSQQDGLKEWHDSAHAAFLKEASGKREDAVKWHWQLSYEIERSDNQRLEPRFLLDAIRQIHSEVQDLVQTGWSMFYVFDTPDLKPNWCIDETSGLGEQDFLECSILRKRADLPRFADLWRVASDGKVTIIRDYWEDGVEYNQHLGWQPGTWLSPQIFTKALGEIVRHARGMSERFDNPTSVNFRIEWHGLKDRVINDPEGRWLGNWSASADHRVSVGSWPVSSLTNGLPEIVSALAGPLMRAFTTEFEISPDWVRGQVPRWRQY
jgi:Putative DNA-binding domain